MSQWLLERTTFISGVYPTPAKCHEGEHAAVSHRLLEAASPPLRTPARSCCDLTPRIGCSSVRIGQTPSLSTRRPSPSGRNRWQLCRCYLISPKGERSVALGTHVSPHHSDRDQFAPRTNCQRKRYGVVKSRLTRVTRFPTHEGSIGTQDSHSRRVPATHITYTSGSHKTQEKNELPN